MANPIAHLDRALAWLDAPPADPLTRLERATIGTGLPAVLERMVAERVKAARAQVRAGYSDSAARICFNAAAALNAGFRVADADPIVAATWTADGVDAASVARVADAFDIAAHALSGDVE